MSSEEPETRKTQPAVHAQERGRPVRPNLRSARTPAHRVVTDKEEWHLTITDEERAAGFKGWSTRGYLPHFDKPGLVQLITYRLADAMPAERREEWQALLKLADERERFREIENYLDRGPGGCLLRRSEAAAVVQENLLHGNGVRYRLLAWVVMPNHVHTSIEQTTMPLAGIVKSWKSYTAHRLQRICGAITPVWQPEYFDRYVRDQEHFEKVVAYVESNPVKAGLVKTAEQWPWSSWRWRMEQDPHAVAYRPETNPLNRPDEYRAS